MDLGHTIFLYFMKKESNKHTKLVSEGIKGSIIGAALGALIAEDSNEGAILGALVGAAVSATLKANEMARESNLPMYFEEDGNLYLLNEKGEQTFVKKINKSNQSIPDSFILT
jgi:outer membrane lipoprotein SlyB